MWEVEEALTIPDPVFKDGSSCLITRNIRIDGVVAFNKGERVIIEGSRFSSEGQAYQYIVYSKITEKRYYLRDDVLVALPGDKSKSESEPRAASYEQSRSAPFGSFGFVPDEPVWIKEDVIVGGELRFKAGDAAQINKVDPSPEMPPYKYVVLSQRSGKYCRLSEKELAKKPILSSPPPHHAAPVANSARRSPSPSTSNNIFSKLDKNTWIAIAIVAFLILIGHTSGIS